MQFHAVTAYAWQLAFDLWIPDRALNSRSLLQELKPQKRHCVVEPASQQRSLIEFELHIAPHRSLEGAAAPMCFKPNLSPGHHHLSGHLLTSLCVDDVALAQKSDRPNTCSEHLHSP